MGFLTPSDDHERNPRGILFEAQLAPHFFFYNGLHALQRGSYESGFLWSVAFSFEMRFRMTADDSIPVRPASFMPHPLGDWQLYWAKPIDRGPKDDRRRVHSFWLLEGRLTPWLHHSDGQQECTFQAGRRDDVPGLPCDEVDAHAPPVDALNFRAGEFATNAVVLATHAAYVHTNRRYEEVFRLAAGLEWEHHGLRSWYFRLLPGGIDAQQRATYGADHFRASLSLSLDPWEWGRRMRMRKGQPFSLAALEEASCESLTGEARERCFAESTPAFYEGPLRLQLTGEVALGQVTPASIIPKARTTVELAYLPRGAEGRGLFNGLGFFVRGAFGRDNLNVLYARGAIRAFYLGILWRQSYRPVYRFLMESPGPLRPGGAAGKG